MRVHRELWLWLGSLFLALFAFLVAVAIAYFLKEPSYSLFVNPWMLGACLSFLIAFTALLGAAQSWTFLPMTAAGFPDITVDIKSIGSTDTERESAAGMDVPAHLRSFHVRFSSAERERSASITVLMYVKLIAGSWGRAGEAMCPVPSWTLSPSLGLTPMSMPFDLPAEQEVSGQLVYEIPGYYLKKLASPATARLEIVDHVSGQRMSVPAELGIYDLTRMTPVLGGAEVLEPDFEVKVELPAIARGTLPDDERPSPAVEQA